MHTLTAFACIGVINTAQDLTRAVLGSLEGAESELVAEETLCLTAVATARITEVGLREAPAEVEPVSSAVLQLPFLYRDYVMGAALMQQADTVVREAGAEMESRLARKMEFYAVHFVPNQFPAERTLTEKMELWMGRVSPPRLPEMPDQRLARLELVPVLQAHLRLVLAYARKLNS